MTFTIKFGWLIVEKDFSWSYCFSPDLTKKKALPAFRNIIFEDKPIMPVAFSGERKKSAF